VKIPFVDLTSRNRLHREQFHAALDRVLGHGIAILGPEVEEFEAALCSYIGCKHALSVGNGTDALILSLRALGVTGGEVITTPMSYLASTSSIILAGATPVFADVGPDLNLDPASVESAITEKTKAILVVHLGGNPARMNELSKIAADYNLVVVEDCAQAFGAKLGSAVGNLAHVAAASFHPLKNLGALGDAGAIFTNYDGIAEYLLRARNHGHSSRDQCDFWSVNSRLDSIQAGFLLAVLTGYQERLSARRKQARRYLYGLKDVVRFPIVNAGAQPSFNFLYILADNRDDLRAHLARDGIDARIHYPFTIPQLRAATDLKKSSLPMSERYTREILSLPLGEHVEDSHIDYVIESVRQFYQ